jgi:hypothetical protein
MEGLVRPGCWSPAQIDCGGLCLLWVKSDRVANATSALPLIADIEHAQRAAAKGHWQTAHPQWGVGQILLVNFSAAYRVTDTFFGKAVFCCAS